MASRKLEVEFIGDTKNLERAFGRVDKKGTSAFAGMGKAAKIAGVAVAGAAVAAGAKMVDLASDAEETASKFKIVFGREAERATKRLDAFSKATGTSRFELKAQAAQFQALIRPMGIVAGKAGNMSVGLTKLATDLASFNNTSVQEAMTALQSGLVGEAEPLRRFGVQLSEARIQAQALSMGLVKTTKDTHKIAAAQATAQVTQRKYNEAVKEHGKNSDEALTASAAYERAQVALGKALDGQPVKLTAAQKAQASYALILKDTTLAQGDAVRTSDSFANQFKRLKANVTDTATELGIKLLPAVTAAVGGMTGFIAQLKSGEGVGGRVADAFGAIGDTARGLASGFQSGVGPARELASALAAVVAGFVAFKVITTITAGITALKGAWTALTAAMAANPFGAVAVVVSGLAAAFGIMKINTRDAAAASRDLNTALLDQEQAMRAVRDLDIDLAQRRLNVKSATLNVEVAQRRFNEVVKDGKSSAKEIRQAEVDLEQARISLERNTRDLADAEKDGKTTRDRFTETTKVSKAANQEMIRVKEQELRKTEASIAQMVRAGHGYTENADKADRLRGRVERLKDEIAGLKNKRFDVTADVKFTLPKGFKTEAASGDPRTLSEKFQAALQASAQGAANAGLFSPIVSGGFPGGTFKGGSWKYANRVAGMFGLRVSSSYRDPIRNAAAGGVPGSLHTHGSPANPGAIDMVGSPGAMYAASAWASRNIPGLRENLVHDAGSGLHLHLGFFKRGGSVPGAGAGDRVPAMLEPGEFVIRKQVVDAFGPTFFAGINGMKGGGQAKKKAKKTQAGMAAKAAPIWEALTAAAHGTRPLRAIEQSLALAELTETLGDDIAAMDERVRFWELRLGVARATGRGITGAAQNLKSARDARSGLTPTSVATTGVDSALDENNRLLAERNALDQQLVANQQKIIALTAQGPQIVAAVVAAINGSIGGRVGLGFHGIRTPVGNVANL